jgi:hypothetical protein
MYHPGKVIRVFSPKNTSVLSSDKGTQALISMWDENLTTVLVHKNLSGKVKVDDIVLIDYRPICSSIPIPKLVVTKVLRGEDGVEVETWKIYKDKYKALKGKQLPLISPPGAHIQPSHSYIG